MIYGIAGFILGVALMLGLIFYFASTEETGPTHARRQLK